MFYIHSDSVEVAAKRLAALMFNIERGEDVCEWTPGSSVSEVFSFELPNDTKTGPPVMVQYKPTVGYIYLMAPPALIGYVIQLLEELDTKYPPKNEHSIISITPHVSTILHLQNCNGRSTEPNRPTIKQVPFNTLSRRAVIFRRNKRKTSHHESRGKFRFSWEVSIASECLPIFDGIANIHEFARASASIIVDIRPTGFSIGPVFKNASLSTFGIKVGKHSLAMQDTLDSLYGDVLVYHYSNRKKRGEFDLVNEELVGKIESNQHNKILIGTYKMTSETSEPLVDEHITCASCGGILYHKYYIINYRQRGRIPLCKWCQKCVPGYYRATFTRVKHSLSKKIAMGMELTGYRRGVISLLTSKVTLVHRTESDVYFLVEINNMVPFFITNTYNRYPCLTNEPALANFPYIAYYYSCLATFM